MCWQQHQLVLHLDFPRDARKQLTCQSRNCQPHSQCQCKTTGSGHHPVNQANPQPQGEKQFCILKNLRGYFWGQKCGFTFYFIQLQLIKSRHNFSDVITHGLIKKYSQFSNSLKTDYETNYYANKHMRHWNSPPTAMVTVVKAILSVAQYFMCH